MFSWTCRARAYHRGMPVVKMVELIWRRGMPRVTTLVAYQHQRCRRHPAGKGRWSRCSVEYRDVYKRTLLRQEKASS